MRVETASDGSFWRCRNGSPPGNPVPETILIFAPATNGSCELPRVGSTHMKRTSALRFIWEIGLMPNFIAWDFLLIELHCFVCERVSAEYLAGIKLRMVGLVLIVILLEMFFY